MTTTVAVQLEDVRFMIEHFAGLARTHEDSTQARRYQALSNHLRDRAATPAAVRSESGVVVWPKLDKPAKVGEARFHAGLSTEHVIAAAQHRYEFEVTEDNAADRVGLLRERQFGANLIRGSV